MDSTAVAVGTLQATRDFDRMGASVEQAADRSTRSLSQVSLELKSIVGGAAALTVVSSLISTVGEAITALPRDAFDYTKNIEASTVGMAGILGSMTAINGKQTEYNTALAISSQYIRKLNDDALRTAATSQELVATFQALLAPGLAAKMTLEQIRELTVVGTNAVKSIGLESNQVVQELRDLVAGGITASSSQLASSLGLRDEDIAKAKASSEGLFTFLMNRLQGFKASSDAFSQTLQGSLDSLKEGAVRVAAEGMTPLITAIKTTVGQASALFSVIDAGGNAQLNPALVESVTQYAEAAVKALDAGKQLVGGIWEHRDAIMALWTAYKAYAIGQWAVEAATAVRAKLELADASRLAAVQAAAESTANTEVALTTRQKIAAYLAELEATNANAQAQVGETAAKIAAMQASKEGVAISRAETLAKLDQTRSTIAQAEAQMAAARAAGAQSFALAAVRDATITLTAAQSRHVALVTELAVLGRQQALVEASIASATVAHTAAVGAATLATTQLTLANSAASVAARSMGAVIGALGGPIGIAVMAIAGMVMWLIKLKGESDDAALAAVRLKRAKDALAEGKPVEARDIAAISSQLEKARSALDDIETRQTTNATATGRKAAALAVAQAEVNKYEEMLKKAQSTASGSASSTDNLTLSLAATQQAWEKTIAGAKTASAAQEEYQQKIDASRASFAAYQAMLEKTKAGTDVIAKAQKRQADTETALAAERDRKLKEMNAASVTATSQTIDAQVEQLKRKAQVEEVLDKRAADMLKSRLQLGLVTERDYLEQVAAAELQGMGKTRDLLTQELALASKKKDSAKEQATLTGQIAELDEKRLSRELNLKNALLELDEKRRKEAEALHAASINTSQQQLDALEEQNRNTQLEIDGIGLTEAAMHRLTNARMDEIIARQEERIEILKKFDLDKESQDLIDIEIRKLEALKNARSLNDQKYGVTQIAKINEAWLTLKNDVYSGLTDSLYRAFEAGNGFFSTFWEGIKNTFKTTVLKVAVQGVVNGVTGLLGLGSGDDKSAGGILGNLGSLGNLFSVGSKLYTAMTTGFSGALGSAVSAVFGGTAGNAAIAASLTGSASSAAAAASAASIAGGGTGAGAGIGASIGSGTAAIPVVGWIAAGMLAASNLYGKGYSAATIDTKTALTTGYGLDMKLNTNLLTSLGLSNKFANILTGAPLISKVMSYFSGESRSGGQYTSANGTTKLVSGPDGGEIAGATVQSAIDSTITGINDLFKTLGSSASVSLYNAGLESSKNGKGFTYAGGTLSDGTTFGEQKDDPNGILHYMNNRGSKTSEEALSQFSLELQQTTIQALQAATDVPQAIKDQLKGVDANKLDAAGIKAVFDALDTTINEVKTFGAEMDALPFKSLQGLSFDATASLLKLAGGLDAFNTSLNSYYKNYYSEADQQAQITKNLAAQFKTLGLAMPTTRDAFKALVDAQDPLTEAGRSTLVALLGLQEAFASITTASVSAADTLKAEAATRLATVTSNASTAYSALERAVAAQRTVAELARDAATEQVNTIQAVFDTLKSNVGELYSSVASASAIQAAKGQAFITQALATAKSSGYLPDNTALADAITAARSGLDNSTYSSQFESDYARLSLAGTLSQLQDLSGTQLSNAELTLKAANAQVDGLTSLLTNAQLQLDAANGIDNSVKSVAAAVATLNTTIQALYAERAAQGAATTAGTGLSIPAFAGGGDHAGGIRMVGETGAELELTGASRIFSASQTRDILRPRDGDGGDSASVVAEVRALREDNRAQALALVQVQSRLNKIIERWDSYGMPAEREQA
ncbi:hypothetical protein [Rhodoferax sp.]|uniref:hypothetical protein n=1 Tax=Rhodoferax sp. TaxID=50421 RepID=UPI00374DC569